MHVGATDLKPELLGRQVITGALPSRYRYWRAGRPLNAPLLMMVIWFSSKAHCVVVLTGGVGIATRPSPLQSYTVVPRYWQAATTPPSRILCSSMTRTDMSVKFYHRMKNREGEGREGMMLCSSMARAGRYA